MTNQTGRGRLLVCFDFEGSYGMPYEVPFDLHRSAKLILEELARHSAQAVFFVVGRMVEDHPEVVREIADAGHEIGLHGYEHDHLAKYDTEALSLFDKNLARVNSLVEDITGSRPQCFRAPYLLAPHFYRAEVYAILRAQGYRWISNREVRYPAELLRPGRIPAGNAWRAADGSARLGRNRLLLGPLNAGLIAKETFGGSPAGRLRWLLGKREPFTRDGRGLGTRGTRLRARPRNRWRRCPRPAVNDHFPRLDRQRRQPDIVDWRRSHRCSRTRHGRRNDRAASRVAGYGRPLTGYTEIVNL
jgi:hypothetical protein